MRFSEDYRLGHQKLDTEHQLLFGIMGDLEGEIPAARGRAVLADLLERLFMYAFMHFATEDRLMMESDYPDAQAHRAEHQSVLSNLKQQEAEYQAGVRTAPEDTLRLMADWARSHILHMDRRLVDYLAKRGG